VRYHGTFLGGPRDGEVYVADRNPVVVNEEIPLIFALRAEDNSMMQARPRYRNSFYHFRQDADGRGWWIRDL
jgi:hypothetical protein